MRSNILFWLPALIVPKSVTREVWGDTLVGFGRSFGRLWEVIWDNIYKMFRIFWDVVLELSCLCLRAVCSILVHTFPVLVAIRKGGGTSSVGQQEGRRTERDHTQTPDDPYVMNN